MLFESPRIAVLRASVIWCLLAWPAAAVADHIAPRERYVQIDCAGQGIPTVILDSGLGGSSLEWVLVKTELSRLTRVCSFDRPGYGNSDMGALPRTSSRIANELFVQLNDAGIDGPLILAGHSFGGYNMQIFARRYSYRVQGLVLVDASHPEQVQRFLEPPLEMLTAPSSRYGIVQFSDPPAPHEALPDDVRHQIRARSQRWKTRRTLASELLSFRDSARQVQQEPALVDMPVVVITRGKSDTRVSAKHELMESRWLEMQTELAAMSSRAAHVIASGAGHHVHIEQPELVVSAIAGLINFVANTGKNARTTPLNIGASTSSAEAVWLLDTLDLSQAAAIAP